MRFGQRSGRRAAPQASGSRLSEKDRQNDHNSRRSLLLQVLRPVIEPSEGPSNESSWSVRLECRLSLNQWFGQITARRDDATPMINKICRSPLSFLRYFPLAPTRMADSPTPTRSFRTTFRRWFASANFQIWRTNADRKPAAIFRSWIHRKIRAIRYVGDSAFYRSQSTDLHFLRSRDCRARAGAA